MKIMKTLLWVAVAAGIFVRAWGLFTDLWLDELWSMNMALSASSPLNLATVYKFKHDNNHILNTVWIYFVGAGRPFYVYRMLAFACGVLSLPLVWSLCCRHGERAAALATMLVATWYQFAHYTSESRGYAPMLFFILLAWWSLDRYLLSATWYHAAIFVSACVLGILSHFSFILSARAMCALNANPSRAALIAPRAHSANASLPQRACISASPATSPGTATMMPSLPGLVVVSPT